jgi:Flp pilus assembly protein TadG
MFINRHRRGRTQRRRGAALVETALVLPIFFGVVLGIIEFGRAFMVAQLLNNAAREGTRAAIMSGSTNTEVETAVKDFASSTIGVSADLLTVTIDVSPATGNPDPNDNVALANKRDLCEVTVSVAFTDVNYLPAEFLSSAHLVGQSAMRHE